VQLLKGYVAKYKYTQHIEIILKRTEIDFDIIIKKRVTGRDDNPVV